MLRNHRIRTGNNTKFKAGHISWNTGKPVRINPATEFKKGNQPANTLFDGAITIRKDNRSDTLYKYTRVSPSKWRLLQLVVWETENGPVPDGYMVTFKDGIQLNCEPENLMLISLADNIKRNQNREKAGAALARIWKRERLRKKYGLPPASGFGKLLINY